MGLLAMGTPDRCQDHGLPVQKSPDLSISLVALSLPQERSFVKSVSAMKQLAKTDPR